MPRLKAIAIFREVLRSLQPGGFFFASFFTEKYFEMECGDSQENEERPELKFMKLPAPDHENLQIVVEGDRLGEIRRFYRDANELKMELLEAGFLEGDIEIETAGKVDSILYLYATKNR